MLLILRFAQDDPFSDKSFGDGKFIV